MNTIKQSFITIIICLIILTGVNLVYAWTGPPGNPPDPNAPAPINVSSVSQIKSGALQVNGFRNIGNTILDGTLKIITGAGVGKVLTSDASGLASWQTPTGGGVSKIIAGTNITISPATGVGDVTINSTAGAGGGYWTLSGANIYNTNTGNVGIGTAGPVARLGVIGGLIYTGNEDTRFGAQISGDWAGRAIFGSNLYVASDNTLRTFGTHASYGYSGMDATWGWLKFYTASGATTQDVTVTPTARMIIDTGGNVGIGTANPGYKLDVAGTVKMTGFQLGTSATAGYVLTTNASGVGTWQAAAGGGSGTVTNIATGPGLTGGPITTTGTISLNTAGINVAACTNGTGTGKIYWDTTNSRFSCGTDQIGAAGSGDITDVIAGSGLTGGASSGSATLNVGAGSGISVAADTVGLSYPSKSCNTGYAIQSLDLGSSAAPTCVSVTGASGVTSVSGSNGITASPTTGAVGVSLAYSSKSCAAGQAIQSFNLGSSVAPTCVATGGTIGTLSCVTKTCSGVGVQICTATCDTGYTLTGGGYKPTSNSVGVYYAYPASNGYSCNFGPDSWGVCYAVCCKVQ